MSQADIDVVRAQFEGVNVRDFQRVMDLYAEDVVMDVPFAEGIANPGTYEGRDAVGEWFGDWFRMFAPDYRFEVTEARELGDGLIYLHAVHHGRGRRSGVEVTSANAYLYRVRGGKVSRVGFYLTREDALQAASLPEWSEAETD